MSSLNISFEIPQTPSFSTEEFRRQVVDYANNLIIKLSASCKPQPTQKHKVLMYDELSPALQDILKLAEPMNGAIPEWDLDGDLARQEALKED